MQDETRNGLKFPTENTDYEIPAELGEELVRRNQELLDAKNRPAPEVRTIAERTGKAAS